MREKFCPACDGGTGKMKGEIHFSGDRTKPDGLSRVCRDCYSEYQSKRRLALKFAGKTIDRLHSYLAPNSI